MELFSIRIQRTFQLVSTHLFALNCNESFRIVVDEKEKRAKLCCLTLSILVFYVKCFIINLLGPPDAYSNRAELHPELRMQRYGFFVFANILCTFLH